jgi:hypothetical protein
MTLSQVLNEKFRPRHRIDRRGVDDDDGGRAAGAARNGRPAASLPRGIREATLQSSFDASSLTPAMMMMGAADDDETADNDDSASCPPPCMEMIYHTRFVMGGTVVALAATSDGSGKAGEDAVIDDSDDDGGGGGGGENDDGGGEDDDVDGGSKDGRLNGNDDDDCGVDTRKGGGLSFLITRSHGMSAPWPLPAGTCPEAGVPATASGIGSSRRCRFSRGRRAPRYWGGASSRFGWKTAATTTRRAPGL